MTEGLKGKCILRGKISALIRNRGVEVVNWTL